MSTPTKKTHRATKKKATKKSPAKKEAPTAAAKETKTDSKLLASARKFLPAIRSGEVSVRLVWRDELKFKSIVPLRNAFIEILGSKAAYLAMLAGRRTQRQATKRQAKDATKKKATTGSR